MRLARLSLLAAALLAFPAHPSVGAESTRKIPEAVGPCFSVHGRISLYNGTPTVRIWIVGTKRILGVVTYKNPEDPDVSIMPAELFEILNWEEDIYGDFFVCPVSNYRPGWMQYVYMKKATNLVIKHR